MRFFLILILITLLIIPHPSVASEYLLHVRANGQDMGFFPATEVNSDIVIDRSLPEALGLPSAETTVVALKTYGTGNNEVDIDLRRQELLIQSTTPFPFQNPQAGSEKAGDIEWVRGEEPWFALKSVDFSTSYSNSTNLNDTQLFLAPSGRAFNGDLDLYYAGDGQPTRFRLGYRDEDREWLRSVELGYIQHPVPFASFSDTPSFSVSNIPLQRKGAVIEEFYLTEPIGSRVEVWREQAVSQVFSVDKIPFLIPLPLFYGGSESLLKIYRPDGSIKEIKVSRETGQEMLLPGELNYYISARQNETPTVDIKLGVTSKLTLAGGYTGTDPYGSARLRIPTGTLSADVSQSGDYIYRIASTLGFSASRASRTTIGAKQTDTAVNLSPKLPWNPTVNLRRIEIGEDTIDSGQFRLFIPYKSLYFNPSLQVYDTEGYKLYGLQAFYFMGADKIGVDLQYNDRSSQFDREATWYHSQGSHQVEVAAGERTADQYISLRYNYRPATGLAIGASYRVSQADYSVGVQVSGSFAPVAKAVIPQAVAQSGLIYATMTDASTGKPLSGAISIDGITHNLSEEGWKLIPVIPYQYHRVRILPDFDYIPEGDTVFDLYSGKGDLTRLSIKLWPVREIDGYIDSKADNIAVRLMDDTGVLVAETQTRFGGYYFFRVPKKSSQYSVVVVVQPQEVSIVKTD